jgi:hypothetical protein
MRPMEFLFTRLWRATAYLPERGRNSTGSVRRQVMVRFGTAARILLRILCASIKYMRQGSK